MKDFDGSGLDGPMLRLFLAVLEEGSVTAAADRLGLSQSAASHALNRLRIQLGDPLFVKAGRGIQPTAHAHSIARPAEAILAAMRGLAQPQPFDLPAAQLRMTIAANDFQRELLLPRFFQRVSAAVASFELQIIHSGAPSHALLREARCDLLISPFPPVATDILRKQLLLDQYACFYDPAAREPPRTEADYLDAQHVTVIHIEGEALTFDRELERRGLHRRFALRVPGFTAVGGFLRGSAMLATLPSLLAQAVLQDLATAPLPVQAGPAGALPMYMAWHRRDHRDERHVWLRSVLVDVAAELRRRQQRAAAASLDA